MKGKAGPGFREQVAKEAKKQGLKMEKPESVTMADQEDALAEASGQQELLGKKELPIKPKAVRDEQMMANYVKPHYFLAKEQRLIGLEISFPLTDDHKSVLPKAVCDEWQHLKRSSSTRVCLDVPPQTVDIRFAPDHDVELHIIGAQIHRATLSVIQEKGTGAAKKVVRFSFRIVSEVMKNISTFADNEFGKVVWIEMGPTQAELE